MTISKFRMLLPAIWAWESMPAYFSTQQRIRFLIMNSRLALIKILISLLVDALNLRILELTFLKRKKGVTKPTKESTGNSKSRNIPLLGIYHWVQSQKMITKKRLYL